MNAKLSAAVLALLISAGLISGLHAGASLLRGGARPQPRKRRCSSFSRDVDKLVVAAENLVKTLKEDDAASKLSSSLLAHVQALKAADPNASLLEAWWVPPDVAAAAGPGPGAAAAGAAAEAARAEAAELRQPAAAVPTARVGAPHAAGGGAAAGAGSGGAAEAAAAAGLKVEDWEDSAAAHWDSVLSLTRELQSVFVTRLRHLQREAGFLSHTILFRASSVSAMAAAVETDAVRIEAALTDQMARAAKWDFYMLNSMLQAGHRLSEATPRDPAEAARLLSSIARRTASAEAVFARVKKSYEQVGRWEEVSRPVQLAEYSIEATELMHRLHIMAEDAQLRAAAAAEGEEAWVLAAKTVQQAKAQTQVILRFLGGERRPVRALAYLHKMRHFCRSAEEATTAAKRETAAAAEERNEAAAETQAKMQQQQQGKSEPEIPIETLRFRAQREAATAAKHAEVVNMLLSRLEEIEEVTILRSPEEQHFQLARSSAVAHQLAKLTAKAAKAAAAAAESVEFSGRYGAVQAGAKRAEELRREVFDCASAVVRCIAVHGAWFQLDNAVQTSIVKLQQGVEALSLTSPKGSQHQRAVQLLRDGNANLTRRRFRTTAQLSSAARHAVGLLGLARRVEQIRLLEETRSGMTAGVGVERRH